MYTVAILNIAMIAFAQRASVAQADRWLKAAFLVLFSFLALRYQYGNDYANYLRYFEEGEDSLLRLEPGWRLLRALFQPLGFFAMVGVLALFNSLTYFHFVKRYVPKQYFGYAVFLYLFNPYFMLVHSSAMRQSVAISIFLWAIRYIEERRVLRYVALVALAATFHTSALVLLPVYLLAWTNGRMRFGVALGVLVLYGAAVFFASDLAPFVSQFVSSYAERYEVYQGGTELGSGLGLIYGGTVLALIAVGATQQVGGRAVLFRIAIISYFATVPLAMVNTIAGRVGMYFAPVLIAVVPYVADGLKDRRLGHLFLATYAIMTLYVFYIFFQSDVWSGPFGTYTTIFSAPQIY
jgi:hypothetical protein